MLLYIRNCEYKFVLLSHYLGFFTVSFIFSIFSKMQDASGLHVDKPKNTRAAPTIQYSDIVGEGPRTSLRQSPLRHTEKKRSGRQNKKKHTPLP